MVPTTLMHIVCFSGGESSAKVAEAVVRRYGVAHVVLLNHDINGTYEDADVKRFKLEVSMKLGVPITYANYEGLPLGELPSQFAISKLRKGFKQGSSGNAYCTYYLKTKPFEDYLLAHYPPGTCVLYYGFDDDEMSRINRRRAILGKKGYETCFPLAEWPDTIDSIEELGIQKPLGYSVYTHANCSGCLKGGIQHWYTTWAHRPDVFAEAMATEEELGYSILKDQRTIPNKPLWLRDVAPVFQKMRDADVPANEHLPASQFAQFLKFYRFPQDSLFNRPCECSF